MGVRERTGKEILAQAERVEGKVWVCERTGKEIRAFLRAFPRPFAGVRENVRLPCVTVIFIDRIDEKLLTKILFYTKMYITLVVCDGKNMNNGGIFMKRMSRLLSVVLACVLLLTGIPFSAIAIVDDAAIAEGNRVWIEDFEDASKLADAFDKYPAAGLKLSTSATDGENKILVL